MKNASQNIRCIKSWALWVWESQLHSLKHQEINYTRFMETEQLQRSFILTWYSHFNIRIQFITSLDRRQRILPKVYKYFVTEMQQQNLNPKPMVNDQNYKQEQASVWLIIVPPPQPFRLVGPRKSLYLCFWMCILDFFPFKWKKQMKWIASEVITKKKKKNLEKCKFCRGLDDNKAKKWLSVENPL